MADDADRAQDTTDHFTALAINKILAKKPAGPSAEYCESCDREILAARRRLLPGVQTCHHCAALAERSKIH